MTDTTPTLGKDAGTPPVTSEIQDGKTIYDELPDAPPRKRIRLSMTGKVSVCIVAFWVFIAVFGQFLAPYQEGTVVESRLDRTYSVPLTVEKKGPFKLTTDMLKDELKTYDRDAKKTDFDVIKLKLLQDGRIIDTKTSFGSLGSKALEVPAPGKYTAVIDFHTEFLDNTFMLPSAEVSSWLGTDYQGEDVLSRLMWGARTTIGISFAATLLAYLIGITMGIAAAVAGGWTDTVFSRTVDGVLAFPNIMLGLIVIAAFGSSIALLVVLGGIVYAASVYRIARALGMDIMVQDYVEAARARGEGLWWIITREVLPNAAMPLATDFGLRLIYVILFVTALGFLGLGVQPPTAEWGAMIFENRVGLQKGFGGGALAATIPALAIASLTIAINLIVDDISAQSGGSLAKKMV